MSALLDVKGLSIDYGGVHANRDVDLKVPAGRLVGLIGPNGAGKTSFVDAVTGFTPVSSGSISFDGHDITRLPAHRRNALGMGRTFQAVELFDDLTVLENLLVAAETHSWWTPLADMFHPRRGGSARENAIKALDSVGLASTVDMMPGELSHGQRKLVGVARTLSANPKMVLFDEPAAGLDTEETAELGLVLRRLVADGLGILLIDHDMGLVLDVCDWIHVLDFGKVIGQGTPDEIKNEPAVIVAYLGEGAARAQEEHRDPIDAMKREVETRREEIQ